ncbi:hypothetical protein HO173_009831 [Letharia columbiana]|uniref:Uncharacterized protein n=1 Tax=Letharia columbiana TaxID=112416 RepID=A0A8H6L1H8_9LECA|nr:uncharacterized protein HO173_009831 [Letharia columbiana]KAF6231994.1 hypothetical protein HO173_009831 [Letharia columbiana]
MGRMTFLELAAVCLLSTTVPSATALSAAEQAAQVLGLLPRASTCSLSGFAPCNQDGLPDNFCCPTTSTCVPFNNKKSAICCPTGQTCSVITAISCDITQQNATLHPESQLFSTDLSGPLASCNGNRCCPNGYSCQSDQCILTTSSITASTSSTTATSSSSISSPKTTSSSSSASASATTSPTSTSATATSIASNLSTAHSSIPQAHCPQFTPAGTLVGFFSGLAIGILLTVAFLCCFGHRRHKEPSSPTSPDFSHVRASISDPIYKSEGMDAVRADFLRKESKPRKSLRSMFSRSSTVRSRSAPVDGIGRSIVNVPRTPVNQRSPSPRMRHEPSMESIKIYSPPGGGLGRPGTQLADMLDEVGWDPTKPYIGSPGRVDPRSRGLGG